MYFALPDDFSGGLANSLRVLADHLDAQDTRNELPAGQCFGESHHAFVWNEALAIPFTGKVALFDFDGYAYQRLPLQVVGGKVEDDICLK